MKSNHFFVSFIFTYQLYEMICVRHGLMIVGLPFGGKTTTYRILAEALEGMEKKVSVGTAALNSLSNFL